MMYTHSHKKTDIFDNIILCRKCKKPMKKTEIFKNGFLLKAVTCSKCKEQIIHPNDEKEYNQFMNLRSKTFRVKLRLVGNSYAVSIPKEIISFIREQEKIMDDMVRLYFEQAGKLSLMFNKKQEVKKRW